MNEEFEKFMREHYGEYDPEDYEYRLAQASFKAGAAAMKERCVEVADNEANGFRNTRIAAAIREGK